jgi:hypothetical protein
MSETGAPPRRLRGPAAILSPEDSHNYYARIGRKSGATTLLLTADEAVLRAVDVPDVALIAKPFDLEDVIHVIGRLLHDRGK